MSSVAAMTKLTLKIGGQGERSWHFFLTCAGPVLLLHLSLCPGSAVAAADECVTSLEKQLSTTSLSLDRKSLPKPTLCLCSVWDLEEGEAGARGAS